LHLPDAVFERPEDHGLASPAPSSRVARFNATESLLEADGSPRTVRYAGTDYLVRVDGTWKVRATTVAFLPEDDAQE
tara:strand:- start:4138 stop:4368 length:231 start_codon:yes stop_codon:yes gene_type:complete